MASLEPRIHFPNGSLTWWASCGEASVPQHTHTSSQGCLGILMAWWLESDPKEQDRSGNVFYDLASDSTHHHFHGILLVAQTNPDTVWEGAHKGMNNRGKTY